MKRTVQQSVLRGALALSILALALAATAARASTAANTQISNQATVAFNDAGGVAQPTVTSAAVTVTVTLVPAAVTLTSPGPQTIAQGASATLSYTITSNANGPDTYNLTNADTRTNVTAVVIAYTVGGVPATSISLGGTTLAAAANVGDTAITVPYDGVAGATVNGIGVGSTIVVGGNPYAVTNVTKNAGANTATITLGAAIAVTGQAIGTVVGEQRTFTASVPSGNVTAGSSGTHSVTSTATSATSPNPATTQGSATIITVDRPTMTVTKTVSVDGGTTFGASANAAPGATVIYKIVAHNSGASAASAVAFTDALPVYLTYAANSGKFATSAATAWSAATAVADGAGGYTYTAGTRTVAYNPGGATGTVAANGDLVLFFSATVN